MSAFFADEGLANQQAFGLQGGLNPPAQMALVDAPWTPAQSTTLASLSLDATTIQNILAGWTYATDLTLHQVIASVVVTWVFSPNPTPPTYYGIAIYSAASGKLAYSETFVTPFSPLTSGQTFIWQENLKFKNC